MSGNLRQEVPGLKNLGLRIESVCISYIFFFNYIETLSQFLFSPSRSSTEMFESYDSPPTVPIAIAIGNIATDRDC